MGLKRIDNLSDGLFVDWEILNKLISNITETYNDVPTVLLHTTAVGNANKQLTYNNKGTSSTKMSIEAGRRKFTNIKGDDKIIDIKTTIDGGIPCVLTTIEGTSAVTSYITTLNSGGFRIHLKNNSNAAKSGVVNWIVIRGNA